MIQKKLIKVTTGVYQFALKRLVRSLEKQEVREEKRLAKGTAQVAAMRETADYIRDKAKVVDKSVKDEYAGKVAEINSSINFLQNVQDDIQTQAAYL